jgi:hypothetical protein
MHSQNQYQIGFLVWGFQKNKFQYLILLLIRNKLVNFDFWQISMKKYDNLADC